MSIWKAVQQPLTPSKQGWSVFERKQAFAERRKACCPHRKDFKVILTAESQSSPAACTVYISEKQEVCNIGYLI